VNRALQKRKRKGKETESNKLFRLISENPGLSVQEISEKLGWTKSKTNRMLSVLERKGWITKRVFSTAQPRIVTKPDETVQRLNDQFARLVEWKTQLEMREKELFDKCVSAQLEGDKTKASLYANQCAEIRKIIRLVTGAEQTISQLTTPEN
jgi:division protein CdvB (Snf7/Vps24/ESCRT-III family)